jgi:hypothetical protein
MGCARFVAREAFAAGFASGFTGDSHFVTREAFAGNDHAMARPYILSTFLSRNAFAGNGHAMARLLFVDVFCREMRLRKTATPWRGPTSSDIP